MTHEEISNEGLAMTLEMFAEACLAMGFDESAKEMLCLCAQRLREASLSPEKMFPKVSGLTLSDGFTAE